MVEFMWTVKGLLYDYLSILSLPSMMALVTINKHIIIPWLSILNLSSIMALVTINKHIIIP
jgi:hypothetical protein